MSNTTQYVRCAFRKGDSRHYTYRNPVAPLVEGDEVMVETKDGEKRVWVAGIADEAPEFACRSVIRKVEPKPAEATADQVGEVAR